MKSVIKNNKIAAMLVLFLSVFGIVYMLTITPDVYGDGNEYMLQTVSIQRHFSFGVTEEDLKAAEEQFYNHINGLRSTYANTLCMHEYNNAKFSNHFGIYSALVTPVKLILMQFNVYPLWAFTVTNYLLWLVAVMVILFVLKTDGFKKLCLTALAIFNPVFFYLKWTHAEVFIFTFVVIGLVFYYNKQYARSIFFLSVACMQNVGVCPFAMIVGIDFIISRILEYKEKQGRFALISFIRLYWKKIIPYGLCYIPAVIPVADTYFRFGSISLVADVAGESRYLAHKVFDLIFDLNLGILPYEPLILIAFIILVCIGLFKNTRMAIMNLLGLGGILFILGNQKQINSGMQNIMRYNVWLIPIMMFYVVMNWKQTIPKRRYLAGSVCLSEVIITTLVIAYVTWGGGSYSCNGFAQWTKWVMDFAPGLYNPTHGIFYSRVLGGETYYMETPVMYCNADGFVRKILLSKEATHNIAEEQWEYIEYDKHKPIDLLSYKRTKIDEGDYEYINLTGKIIRVFDYSLGNSIICYSEDSNILDYATCGVSQAENWGSWTDGDSVCINMALNDEEICSQIRAYIDVTGTFYQPQRVNALINDSEVYSAVIEGDQDIEFVFNWPEDGIVNMKILLPDSRQPSELGLSMDSRDLGIGLREIVFSDASQGTEEIKSIKSSETIWLDTERNNAGDYVVAGFSHPEDLGTWTDGDKAEFQLLFRDDSPVINGSINVLETYYAPQRVSVMVNGEMVFDEVISGVNSIDFVFNHPQDDIVNVELLLPDSVQPSEVSDSTDTRDLGLYISSIIFTGEENSSS